MSDTAAAEAAPDEYQRTTWTAGTLVFGFAVATCGLAGAIVLRVRPWAPEPGAGAPWDPPNADGFSGVQVLGVLMLLLGAALITVGKAAQQTRGRLLEPVRISIDRFSTGINDLWSPAAKRPPLRWLLGKRRNDTNGDAKARGWAAPEFDHDAVTDVGVAAIASVLGCICIGVGATWLAQLGVLGGIAGIGVSGAATSVAGLLSSSRHVVVQAGTLAASMVVIAMGARLGAGERALVIVVGLAWTALVWGTIVAARHARLWALMGAVAAGTVALALLDELDNTLRSLTSPGRTPRGFGDLAPLTSPSAAIDRVRDVGTTWREFRTTADPGDTVPLDHTVRLWYVIIDSGLLAVAYPLLFFVLARRVSRRLGNDVHALRLKSILTVTQFAMPILIVLDIAENFSGSAAVQPITGTQRQRRDLADIADALAVIHWLASMLKWLTILGAVVALIAGVGWVVTRPRVLAVEIPVAGGARKPVRTTAKEMVGWTPPSTSTQPGVFRRWNSPYETLARSARSQWTTRSARTVLSAAVLLRASIAIVVIVVLALRNPQTYDAIRVIVDHSPNRRNKSQVNFVQAMLLIGLALLAGFVIRFFGELLVRQLKGNNLENRAGRVGHALIVLSFALVFALTLDSPGLLVAIGIYGAIEVLSLPLRVRQSTAARAESDPDDDAERSNGRKAWRLGAGVAVALLLAAFAAQRLGTTRDVRWVLVAVSGLIALHATAQIILPRFAPHARLTDLVVVRSRNAVTEDETADVEQAETDDQVRPDGLATTPPTSPVSPSDAGPTELTAAEVHDSKPPEKWKPLTHRDDEFVRAVGTMAAVLGAIVPIVIGAAVARSALGLIIYGDAIIEADSNLDNQGDWVLLGIGVALAVLGVVVQSRLHLQRLPSWSQTSSIAAVRLVLALVVVAYLLAWQGIGPDDVIGITRDTGAIGVLMLFVILTVTIGTTISYVSAETRPLAALELLGFTRPPFFALAVVWLLIAGTFDDGGYHDVPILEDRPELSVRNPDESRTSEPTGLSLLPEEALETWIAECAGDDNDDEAVPMLFVAASGGGIRAAYWTASTLERLDVATRSAFEDRCNPIFAASGASGGSLGLGVYVVDDLTRPGLEPPNTKDRLADDYLSPTVSWFLFADLVRPFLLWDRDGSSTIDRGEMLERSWAMPERDATTGRTTASVGRCAGDDEPQANDGEDAPTRPISLKSGLRETWCLGAPLLIFNGTEVSSGCRFIASVLDNGDPAVSDDPTAGTCLRPRTAEPPDSGPLGATIDLVDHLCPDQDVSLATAALLSARFPFVSPSGRVPARSCDGDAADDDAPLRSDDPAFVVDGGYIDNSGAGPVVQLWADISTRIDRHNAARVGTATPEPGPCIVPVFLQLDNGYDFDAATTSNRPHELLVPLQAAAASRGSREAEAKQIASEIFYPEEFSGAITADVNRWFRVVPEAHPGIQAPLGWVLSDAAQADLNGELRAQLARAQGDDDDGTRVPAGELRQLIDVLTDDLTCTQVTDDQ